MIQPVRAVQLGVGGLCVSMLLIVWRLLFDGVGTIGLFGIVIYLLSLTAVTGYVLYRGCFFHTNKASTWGIAAAISILTVYICVGVPIVFWQFSASTLIGSLVGAVLLISMVTYGAHRSRQAPQAIQRAQVPGWYAADVFRSHYLWLVVYGAVWVFGMVLALAQPSVQTITSPWHALPGGYLTAVAVGGIILVLLLFSRVKTSWILGIIVLQSILMHVYIPAAHVLPAGGDVWRHIGRAELLLTDTPINPVLFGEIATYSSVGPVVLPDVLVHPGKFAYSAHWGMLASWELLTGHGYIGLSRWFVPLFFAIAMPLLLFYIGHFLFRSRRHALVISAATLVPFSMLALGSLSLPVTMGYIYFMLALLLLLVALRYGTRVQWLLVVITVLGGWFVYPLHVLLMTVIGGVSIVMYRLQSPTYDLARPVLVVGFILLLIPLLPIAELALGMSTLPQQSTPIFETLQRIIGEHSGWYMTQDIRPFDTLSGNILFNHIPLEHFTANLFTTVRWPLLLIAIGIYGFALFGWGYTIGREKRINWQVLSVLAGVVWFGYGLSWYFLDGEHQLVRRLDMLFALLLLLFAWYGLSVCLKLITHTTTVARRVTAVLLLVCMGGWWASMTALSLGPDVRYMSTSEGQVGAHIARGLGSSHTCVLADTWVLLAVEAASAGQSIGGGFAMDAQYGQPVRTALYDRAVNAPSSTLWGDIAAVHADTACTIAVPIQDPMQIRTYDAAFGTSTLVGTFGVWRTELPTDE